MNQDLMPYMQVTPCIDFNHDTVQRFARDHAGNSSDPVTQAVNLYYAVRDGIRYNPYKFNLSVEGLKASTTIAAGEAWCVPKAVLLAACCRLMGIPALLGYADVRNHLSTARMRERMQTDIYKWHGYAAIYLAGKWVKSTPAFNIELCEKFRLKPLEFDGKTDSIYHAFDLEGNRHMEYLQFRGEYADVPLEEMMASFEKQFKGTPFGEPGADFTVDVEKETARLP